MAAPSQRGHRGSSRSGSSSGAAIHVIGLKEFRRELKKLEGSREWNLMLAREQRDIARKAAGWSQDKARGMGRSPQSHFANMIKGRGGATGARVSIDSTANAAFWGAKKRTGFYARYRFRMSTGSQHPAWVGAGWDVAVAGQGPYAINAALAAHVDDIVRLYGEGIDRVTQAAFPN